MNNFEKIEKQIKEKQIKPIPKWKFTLKNILLWSIFFLSLLIGASAFSIILFSIQQTDFDLINHFQHSWVEKVLVFLPFFWVIILIVFSLFAFISFSKSKKAYKYSPTSIVFLSTFLSILFGTLFFISGGAQKIEKAFANKVSIYKSIEQKKLKMWMQPENGLLSGSILKKQNDTIYLKDFDNKQWQVFLNESIFVPPIISFEAGEKIRIIGKTNNNHIFIAEQIRPWGGFRNPKK